MAEIINMPKLGFDMAEGVLVRWVKNVGETIQKGDVLAEIETDKATVEVESAFSGVVLQQLVDPGTSVPVNDPIAVVGEEGEKVEGLTAQVEKKPSQGGSQKPADEPQSEEPDAEKAEQPAQSKTAADPSDMLKASPLARKVARDKGVDLGAVVGTGPGGRIVRRDVDAALAAGQKADPQKAEKSSSGPTNIEYSNIADETIQTTKLRQAIGRRLVESKSTIPHFYLTHEYKLEALLDLRKQLNGYLPEGEKLSLNDFVLKAVALSLREFPNLNATLSGDKIIRKGEVNVGVAVTVPGGLMTVVVKNTDQKPLRVISSEVKAMAARARDGKVKPEDVDGSTFSTSNLGMYDVEDFIAIINPPEAAILAISSAREVPVVENGQLKIGWRMKVTISVDHRISDGAEAAQFMQALAKYLEEPVRMLV
ncbi:MAG: dihydrolipoamide acetyltransferase family protein [Anaerolineales bacterium]|jgi:pyruvate dehydrogenase E2 component (dihydrolipoamide acetyltransferase)|nr:dihydrolipoamide acetyltransferase family protein [Anaerolineales bacterium]